ncbi:MAG: FAD-dependent oxidoreductase [Acidobacteriota bacterium]
MSSSRTSRRVAVIGSGLAGLTCAHELQEAGLAVTVLDKGRGAGGRASTRRAEIDGQRASFDHGAQYFTARDPVFASLVAEWREASVVARWTPRLTTFGDSTRAADPDAGATERWVGTPGMSSLLAHLEQGLDVRRPVRAERLERRDDGWWLQDTEGAASGPFDEVVVAVPASQAAELLAPAPELARAARDVAMPPCWAVLVAWEERLDVPFDAAFVNDAPLAWLARDSSKPGRPDGERWVLHGAAEWSREHFDDEPSAVIDALLSAAAETTGWEAASPSFAAAHRWAFARVDGRADDACLHDAELGIGACGDWCVGGRMEGAWLSGRALAARLLGRSRDA